MPPYKNGQGHSYILTPRAKRKKASHTTATTTKFPFHSSTLCESQVRRLHQPLQTRERGSRRPHQRPGGHLRARRGPPNKHAQAMFSADFWYYFLHFPTTTRVRSSTPRSHSSQGPGLHRKPSGSPPATSSRASHPPGTHR